MSRKAFALMMAAGTLLFVAAFVFAARQQLPALSTARGLTLAILAPALVYLVARFARPAIVVSLLGAGLLALAAETAWQAPLKSFDWLRGGAMGLCGIGLMLRVRGATYLWYAIVFIALALYVDLIRTSYRWDDPAVSALLLLGGLFLFVFALGGSVAVASAAAGRHAPSPVAYRADAAFAALCAVIALLVAAHWSATRAPDPEGFAQLHPDIKSWVGTTRSHTRTLCSAINYCGRYVELICYPEGDGPVQYHDNTNGALIMECGGACMGGQGRPGSKRCTACPPPEWTSCTGAASTPR